jgi:DNA topoisomerase-1
MAKRTPPKNGKSLVIVESPAKARTIGRYLGGNFRVEASIGHIRDLPGSAKEIPAKYKGEGWARLGVDVENNFDPLYIVPSDKAKQVKKLKDAVDEAKDLYLATDEDREGEAISWHLCEVLKPKIPVRRLVFHEITEEAIQDALANPREIDSDLVQAQEARRILDRLYGYEVSPLLWRKVRPKLSAGRVQSVAVRLIVERERQRMAFVSATWWDLDGLFAKTSGEELSARLVSVDGREIPSGKDFDPATGKLKNGSLLLLDEPGAKQLAQRLRGKTARVVKVEEKPYINRPYPPFTTSTLQQEANRKLGFTARRTMQAAQSLYENGHITYMRTDSTNLATVAIEAARDLVTSQYGREYLPAEPRVYKSKVKNAQEAHEAIRPAGHPFALPEQFRGKLGDDEFKLYDLIWKRTVASQMADSRGRRVAITIDLGGATFVATGSTIDFAGYLRAYVEGSDDPEAELADRETVLPSVAEGETLACRELEPKGHTTQPPSRFTEAALTKALEERGIGRPSTYASIIDTILARNYVFKKSGALVPTWTAFSVSQLMEKHLPKLVDYDFTAQMEDDLDAISRGEAKQTDYLRRFYFGNGQPGLKQQLDHKAEEIDAREVCSIALGKLAGATEPVTIRVGRYGPYIEHGDRRASIPDDLPPDELTLARCLELLNQAKQAEEPLGIDPDTHKPVFLKNGRFGPYVQLGTADDEEKPKMSSLLRGMQPADVDLATALKLLSLPRTVGNHPQSGEPIVAQNGRFGPYIKCGSETRSLTGEMSPLTVTLDETLALLAQPKTRGRNAVKKEPLKTFDASPVTGEPVKLLDGRYGPYVTDGTTNASLPRDTKPEELTLEQALTLLADRAARGPSTKRPRRRAAPKAASPKASPKKSTKPAASSSATSAKKRTGGRKAAQVSAAGSSSPF